MMRILQVITSLEIGGAEKLMVDLLPRLNSEENQVDLLVFNGIRTIFTEQIEAKGVKVYSLSNSSKVYNPLNVFRLIPYLKRYDIIHTHNTACQLFVPIAKTLSFAKCKLVTTEHSTQNRRRGNSILRAVDKWMYNRYRNIICVSDDVEVNLRSHLGDKKHNNKIITINNGVDCQKFALATPTKDLLGIDSVDKVVLMVARFAYPKDQNTLISALTYLPNNVHAVFVGQGETLAESIELSKSLGNAKRVHFLGARSDIPELMKSADVIVLSSHYEGLSLSSLEAMSSGRPFVASDVPGLREIVAGVGLLFPDGDYEMLSSHILNLMNDKDFYNQIVKSCLARAKQFDVTKTMREYLSCYIHQHK